MAIDLEAPLRFLDTAFRPDDWIAVLLKSHDTGGAAQRVGPMSLVANPKFQAWLRAENARRFSVFVSVNAIRPQRKARTRDAIGEIRHVFLDADRDGSSVLARSRRAVTFPRHPVSSTRRRTGCTCLARLRIREGERRGASEAARHGTRHRQGRHLVRAGDAAAWILQRQVPTRSDGSGRAQVRRPTIRAAGLSGGRAVRPERVAGARSTPKSPICHAADAVGSGRVDTWPRFRQLSPVTGGTQRRFGSAAVWFAALRLARRTRSASLRTGTRHVSAVVGGRAPGQAEAPGYTAGSP